MIQFFCFAASSWTCDQETIIIIETVTVVLVKLCERARVCIRSVLRLKHVDIYGGKQEAATLSARVPARARSLIYCSYCEVIRATPNGKKKGIQYTFSQW